MLVSTKKLLNDARQGHYAVPAFNTSDLEMTMGIMRACEKLGSPVILATSERQIRFSNEREIYAILRTFAKEAKVPVAIHLDHGGSFEQAKKCIDIGYTSIHIDGSSLPYEENIEITKKVVAYAKKKNVSVEGELGHIITPKSKGDKTDRTLYFTDPEKAVEFVKKTGIDSLAISVGTAHGAYKGETNIDFDRLREIGKSVDVPLVLHGGSMVPKHDIQKAIQLGISKININTELRLSFTKYLRYYLVKNKRAYVPEEIMKGAIEAVAKDCEDKIEQFGSSKKG
ncbi:tagatose-bisphosphate aldolase [bacterium (Candidatus Howlettbacteria) CG_4_10_14_0_8_um_filter_40_9]|nr:MAG: tagatose-bisphosphate aldolase [bacterium (Candidatus Howlettbacteria) CG_4_10_14_0_8_um_filter_40_9]